MKDLSKMLVVLHLILTAMASFLMKREEVSTKRKQRLLLYEIREILAKKQKYHLLVFLMVHTTKMRLRRCRL